MQLIKRISKIYLILAIYLSFNTFSYSQENVLVYANDNYWSVFILDFNANRYCYSFAKDAFVGCSIYSRGNFVKKKDTIILKSDYDNMKLPFDVKCNNKSEIGHNEIVFNFVRYDNDPFNDAAYKIERKNLYFIINNIDTINIDEGTIRYYKNIKDFYIASIVKLRLPYVEYFDDIPNTYEEFINYKTEVYNNVNSCNNFEITFCLNFNHEYYKPLNDTIVFNKSKAIWYLSNEEAYVNLKKTSLKKVQLVIDDCECWDKQGTINLDVDTPFCSKPN